MRGQTAKGKTRVTHGMRYSRIYMCWTRMFTRCTNPKSPSYSRYGGRGITVCQDWFRFEQFHADMGDMPEGMSLDRIDNDGNYEAVNCRWATVKQQARNKSQNRIITTPAGPMCIMEASEKFGIHKETIAWRLNHGWDDVRAVTQAIRVWP